MQEIRDVAEADEPDFEPRSRTVSFPDHYLVPYIEMCKRSKLITCVCCLFFIGLATFFFFSTNYIINYPQTVSRKIAFVFLGIFSLVAAFRCLNLRFHIIKCGGEPDDNVQFEIVRRDMVPSDSFSAYFEDQETSFCNGTPKERSSSNETPDECSSSAHTIDDPSSTDISIFRHNGHARPPRHSISDGMTPNTPLLPQWKPLGLFRQSSMKNGVDSESRGIVSDSKYPPNYSTFENGRVASDTKPKLAISTSENVGEASDTKPKLEFSTSENGRDASDTKPNLAISTSENGRDVSDTKPLLTNLNFENGCETSDTKPLLADSNLGNGCDTPETESTFQNGCDNLDTEPLLSESFQ